jgi:hypothetical protein
MELILTRALLRGPAHRAVSRAGGYHAPGVGPSGRVALPTGRHHATHLLGPVRFMGLKIA